MTFGSPRLLPALAAVFLLALFAASPLHAQYFGRNKVQYEDFDWRVLRTENFDVHFYRDEEPVVDEVARMAERWQTRLTALFDHRLSEDKPIVLYASHADFQQTNVTPGLIGQGTGGFTDALRNRVVMPLTETFQGTNHVLGHELVHVYQYDIAQGPGIRGGLQSMNRLPLWLIEGMAEYLSIGRVHPLTATWLRDDVLRGRRPTIEQLTEDPSFFPYRYGHALWAYIGGRWGDRTIPALYRRSLQVGFEDAIPDVLGLSAEQLSKDWIDATYEVYLPLVQGRTAPAEAGDPVLVERDEDDPPTSIGPAVSPDGQYVAFFSGRALFGIELYLASARTGEIIRQLTSTQGNAHFEAISFLESAGAWSPDGRKFAFIVFDEGDTEINILDVSSTDIERQIDVPGVDGISTLSWSPDGTRLVFSASSKGISDLFTYELGTNRVQQLTDDLYADIHPVWSPDGRQIAFATDRAQGTNLDLLSFVPPRLALFDLEQRSIRPLEGFGPGVKHINPQFSPDGRDLYFVADHRGFNDIFRMELATGQIFQVTRLATGVSGITELAVAMSVARQSGRMLFSVFEQGGHNIYGLDAERARGTPVTDVGVTAVDAGVLPPAGMVGTQLAAGLVDTYLADASTGLPPAGEFPVGDYSPTLRLDYIGTPTLGVAVNQFGTSIGGGVAAYFGDLLGNRGVGVALQASGQVEDFGGQVMYENLANRWNWGAIAGYIPHLTGGTQVRQRDDIPTGGGGTTSGLEVEQYLNRVYVGQAGLFTRYPFSQTRRFEAQASIQTLRYSTEVQQMTIVNDQVIDRNEFDLPAPEGINFLQGTVAYVGDYSFFGFTSPISGGRYRFEVAPTFGDLEFQTLTADYRRYFFMQPVTLAFRGLHYGRYGADADDNRLPPIFLGSNSFVRGYTVESFDVSECTQVDANSNSCPEFDRLVGSRMAIANLELRIPLLGPAAELNLIDFFLPVEIAPFVDAGVAWTADDSPDFRFDRETIDRVPVASAGVSARVNLLGYAVVQFDYARPFHRDQKGWVFAFSLQPGY